MNTWHIHIEGQVQGVGFRPFVYLLANEFKLNGWVNNTIDGVHIEINAEEEVVQNFYQKLIESAPVLARITKHQIAVSSEKFFENFQIIHSNLKGDANLLMTPDFGLCKDCQKDINTAKDRRFQYPFTTCTNCGPRYSIIDSLPYDRERTTMTAFSMCESCQVEYNQPLDRRYYSQTNSCPDCGIQMRLFDDQQQAINLPQGLIINEITKQWSEGKIVAIKGIGGYLLTCDATNESTIQLLRKRKHRPTKPFALMFSDVDTLEVDTHLQSREIAELKRPISPIVLLDLKVEKLGTTVALAPNLNQIGAMLPYTPLFDLLLKNFGQPIVATSGNISNSPIVFEDKKAISALTQIADFVVTNNRQIVIPQDDSVVKFTTFKKHKIILRRSRGLAPTYINPQLGLPKTTILATGAMLKSTFSFLHQNNVYISQYMGDLGHFDTEENYRHTIKHFLNLFKTAPKVILTDKHPEYPATLFGEHLSKDLKIPIHKIQHHIAHFGAVIGEHNLVHSKTPILGVVWDGTGLGDDKQIWGGEFFRYENYEFVRSQHFDYFDFILGDKMPKEPRISALSACWDVLGMEQLLKEKFSKTEWSIYNKILAKENPLKTSSIGRIFDAVASLLGILDKQTYEGEAAMQLEQMATQYFKRHGLNFPACYFKEKTKYQRIPTKFLMTKIIKDLKDGQPKAFIAAKFHYSLMKLIEIIANNLKIKKIAFSGGVFQNGLLVDLIHHHLSADFELYFHEQLSPNDENISFGQLVCYQIAQIKADC